MSEELNEHAEKLLNLISQRTGLTFPPDRQATALRAVSELSGMPASNLSAADCWRLIQNAESYEALIERLTVGETYFFREVGMLGFLRDQVQSLVQASPDRLVRIWSAGCSSGDEPYTIAMMLSESGLMESTSILGTDLSAMAIRRAEEGKFRRWSLRGPGTERVRRWLRPAGDEFRIDDSIRNHVHFDVLNLVDDIYPSPSNGTSELDFILCRNVLIYLDRNTAGIILERFFHCLRPGGWLLLGSSDPWPDDSESTFICESTPHGLAWRRPLHDRDAASERAVRLDDGSVSAEDINGKKESAPAPVQRNWRQRSMSAMSDRNFSEVVAVTRDHPDDSDAAALHVQALASLNPSEATAACEQLLQLHPLSAELHYLRGLLKMGDGHLDEAAASVKKSLYLDHTLIMAHFLQAMLQQQSDDSAGATLSFRNARNLAQQLNGTECVPLSDGETARDLIAACNRLLKAL